MSRHLTILALVAAAGLALSACDANSTLAKAKPGECYSVEGRNAAGAPVFAKTACAGSPAALAAACPKPAPATVAPGAACAVTGTKVAASAGQASGPGKAHSITPSGRDHTSRAAATSMISSCSTMCAANDRPPSS